MSNGRNGRSSGAVALGLVAMIAACAWTSSAQAQDAAPLSWGGVGHAWLGVQSLGLGGFNDALKASLGDDAEQSPLQLQFGGGGWLLFAERVILRGGGYGVWSPSNSSDTWETQWLGGGGGLSAGFLLQNNSPVLVYPFVGFGGFQHSVEITNLGNTPLVFGDQTIAVGASETFSAGYATIEMGVGGQWFMSRLEGGWALGFELGLTAAIQEGGWETSNGVEVANIQGLRPVGGYLRLTLGGGGFDRVEP